MGQLSIFDIISSAVIAGVLMLTMLSTNARMNQVVLTGGSDVIVQQNLVTIARIMEKDLRRIGYCADPSKIQDQTRTIVAAGAHNISFLTDVNNDGIVDTLQYDVGQVSSLTATPNPRDMLLNRYVRGTTPKGFSVGLTRFDFTYYNSTGDTLAMPISDLSAISYLKINIRLESTHPYDSQYQYAAWRQMRLKVRNLNSR